MIIITTTITILVMKIQMIITAIIARMPECTGQIFKTMFWGLYMHQNIVLNIFVHQSTWQEQV